MKRFTAITHTAHGSPSGARRRPARGVATLVVVMILFFVVAMVAAYTSRNLIFEQRTSANQYRSSVAFEAAEAGVEWTLAMLNGGSINDLCNAAASGSNFQQRYLQIAADGAITAAPGRSAAANPLTWPTCAFDGARWNSPNACTCPSGASQLAPAASTLPAFRAWLPKAPELPSDSAGGPGLVGLRVNGCTRMSGGATPDCLAQEPQLQSGDAVAGVRAVLALRSGIAAVPSAAVTAQGSFTVQPATPGVIAFQVVNADARSNGITVNAGANISSQSSILGQSFGGTPSDQTMVAGDTRLASFSTVAPGANSLDAGERMFVSQFGMRRTLYVQQPGVRTCPSSTVPTCSASALNALQAANPNRILWVNGDLNLDASLGTALSPVLLIVDGRVLQLAAGVKVIGFVYLTGRVAGVAGPATLALPASNTASIDGALMAESSLVVNYGATAPAVPALPTITYTPAVLNVLRTSYGSWVRLPGGWRDFKD